VALALLHLPVGLEIVVANHSADDFLDFSCGDLRAILSLVPF
jgi:hypothetical protein